ncbi:MAG: hypothetical protein NXH95_08385 [Pseudomonadaceae bacterium]|nr:hypothetical protein [Pseudomonadaceae bacterium]
MSTVSLSGEKYDSKVGGTFASEAAAQRATEQLVSAGFRNEQISLVRPDDAHPGRKIEPESKGIVRTMVKAHLLLGATGLLLGLLVASFLVLWSGFEIAASSPVMIYVGLSFLGGAAGLLLGGLYGLRPDHDALTQNVKAAANDDNWSVVVHTQSEEEKHRAGELLEQHTDVTHETL